MKVFISYVFPTMYEIWGRYKWATLKTRKSNMFLFFFPMFSVDIKNPNVFPWLDSLRYLITLKNRICFLFIVRYGVLFD